MKFVQLIYKNWMFPSGFPVIAGVGDEEARRLVEEEGGSIIIGQEEEGVIEHLKIIMDPESNADYVSSRERKG